MKTKTISVIIPAYNSEKTILKCLEALHKQTLPPLEIIVVNDSSTDRTVELSKNLAIVVCNKFGKGAGGARNTGASIASGSILAFTDSDCIPPPDWLEKISNAFKEEGIEAVAGGYSGHEGKNFISNFAFLELVHRRRNFPDYVKTAVSNNLAISRELFDKVGGFPEFFSGATAEDLIISFHISRFTKIRWLKNNGIRHHFPNTICAYLNQQYRFGRDAVVAYKKFPELATIKTHHGYLLYIESLIACLTLCATIKIWPWFFTGVFLLWLLNI